MVTPSTMAATVGTGEVVVDADLVVGRPVSSTASCSSVGGTWSGQSRLRGRRRSRHGARWGDVAARPTMPRSSSRHGHRVVMPFRRPRTMSEEVMSLAGMTAEEGLDHLGHQVGLGMSVAQLLLWGGASRRLCPLGPVRGGWLARAKAMPTRYLGPAARPVRTRSVVRADGVALGGTGVSRRWRFRPCGPPRRGSGRRRGPRPDGSIPYGDEVGAACRLGGSTRPRPRG